MIDLCITGYMKRDVLKFTIDGETKTIDQFTKSIHFSLENNRVYRINFEQQTEQYIPRYAEIVLNLLFLPVRGLFNIITFDVNQNWEKDVSAFRVFGYIEVKLNEDTEVFFEFKHGNFDEKAGVFSKPGITFSSDVSLHQTTAADPREVCRRHFDFLLNVASVSVLFFALFIFLSIAAFKNELLAAFIFVLAVMVAVGVLVGYLAVRSFKKRKRLLRQILK